MNELIERLESIFQSGNRIAFLGVGSPLRGDDAVGLMIVNELMQKLKTRPQIEVRFYLGESAPENFTGEIREFAPTQVIIVDAAELGLAPGTFSLIEREAIGGISFSTHVLPLKIIADYLVTTTNCEVLLIGIQPQELEFAMPISSKVTEAAHGFIAELLSKLNPV